MEGAGGFFELIRKLDLKGARERLEALRASLAHRGEFWRGYLLALQGMVVALNGSEDSLVRRIIDGRQNIEALKRDISHRLSLKFRPEDEQGFDRAWLDFLQHLSP